MTAEEALTLAYAYTEESAEGMGALKGKDGYTPIKGKDYWTDADKEGIVADVISALPMAEREEY